MNKTTNQYINQLNLDPKREAAVRKLVEGAGGVSDSTPLVENLVGNELIPIKQDGENKAVSIEQIKNKVINNGIIEFPSKYEFVDLGLPSGTKWATCNIGAVNPEDAGLYFAWGETQGYTAEDVAAGKKAFSWNDYKFTNDGGSTFTKYNEIDGKLVLDLEDDAAYQSDNICRIPSKEELQELIDNTTSVWETLNSINGRRFTSKTNGNSIFIPVTDCCADGSVANVVSRSYLWSSCLSESYLKSGYELYFNSDDVDIYTKLRYYGFTIRPIQPADIPTTINLKELYDKVDNIKTDGDGTKFLADDGSYKEISSGSEPYIIDLTGTASTPEVYQEVFNIINNDIPRPLYIREVGKEELEKVIYAKAYEGTPIELNVAGYESHTQIDLDTDGTYNYKFYQLASLKNLDNVKPYIWNGTTSETIFNELKKVIESNRTIILGNGYNYTAIDKNYNEFNSDITLTFIDKKCDPNGPYWVFTITSSSVVRKFTGSGIHYLSGNPTLEPNCYNKIDVVPLNINFTFGDNYVEHYKNRYIYQYQGEFSFGDTVYTVTFPDAIKWSTDSVLEYKANHTYQFRIVNGLGIMKEFANS